MYVAKQVSFKHKPIHYYVTFVHFVLICIVPHPLYLFIHQSDNGGDQCYFYNYFLSVIYLFFYCMYVFFIIMFYCVYGQMSEIKNYYYYKADFLN